MSSANRYIYLKLNNLDNSRENIARVAEYLRTRRAPKDLSDRNLAQFIRQYGLRFALRDDKVFYEPLNLEWVPEDGADAALQPLYDDFKTGAGAGIRSFYSRVQQRFFGINRVQVAEFLAKQAPYQLQKRPPRPINKPVIGEYPNHRWEADLVSMERYAGHNKQRKHILTVIDVFSRYVWARPLLSKSSAAITNALTDICNTAGVRPVILQVDGGGEFKGDTTAWAAANPKVKVVNSLSYTPQTNGAIESFNGILRKYIRDIFVRTNKLDWISHLQDCCDARNNTKHSRLRATPAQIWRPTRVPTQAVGMPNGTEEHHVLSTAQLQRTVNRQTKERAAKVLERYEDTKLFVGDRVRIKLTAIDSRMRELVKSGNTKGIAVNFTPDVYQVIGVYQPRKHLAKPQYLTNYSGKKFFSSDLQKVDAAAEDVDINVDKLNKL